jgi:hypothetical protein
MLPPGLPCGRKIVAAASQWLPKRFQICSICALDSRKIAPYSPLSLAATRYQACIPAVLVKWLDFIPSKVNELRCQSALRFPLEEILRYPIVMGG